MASTPREHDDVLRRALDDVFVLATRWGVDIRRLVAEFDVDRGPGPHATHTLTARVREKDIAVTITGIPHEWLSTGTGFVDTRFSRLVTSLLADLTEKALAQGYAL